MKSQPSVRYYDTKLVERFMNNSSYGCKTKGSRNIYIINPSGASERCISHFTFSLAHNLDYSYISRERRLYSGEEEIGANYSTFYKEYSAKYGPKTCILLMVGKFYELYDFVDANGETTTSIRSAVERMNIALKEETNKGPHGETMLKAGIPEQTLHKFSQVQS